jgi:branched-chain amino acid transport system ATP-binding protein
VGAVAALSALLETRALTRHFGGLEAVSRVDFRLENAEVRALIGPNGAGKTTLVSLISGRLAPSAGQVLFGGRDITRLPAWHRVGLGIVYTFQITSVYRRLSVHDNVALAAQRRRLRGLTDWLALDRAAVAADVDHALATVGLGGVQDQPAGALPHGHQRLLEIAMALALRPALLILDEPTQGLAAAETDAVIALVRQVARGATVLIIEHNMAVVLEVADRVTVMDGGRILAEGTPRQIEADTGVQRAYLGR